MKRFVVALVLVFGLLIGGLSASAVAADPVPEYGSWEYLQALEMGALPPAEEEEAALETMRVEAFIPTIDVGGESFRLHVDTP